MSKKEKSNSRIGVPWHFNKAKITPSKLQKSYLLYTVVYIWSSLVVKIKPGHTLIFLSTVNISRSCTLHSITKPLSYVYLISWANSLCDLSIVNNYTRSCIKTTLEVFPSGTQNCKWSHDVNREGYNQNEFEFEFGCYTIDPLWQIITQSNQKRMFHSQDICKHAHCTYVKCVTRCKFVPHYTFGSTAIIRMLAKSDGRVKHPPSVQSYIGRVRGETRTHTGSKPPCY